MMKTSRPPGFSSRPVRPLVIAVGDTPPSGQHRASLARSNAVNHGPRSPSSAHDGRPALSPSFNLAERPGTPDLVSAVVAAPSWERTEGNSSYLYEEASGQAAGARRASPVGSDSSDERRTSWSSAEMIWVPPAEPGPSSPSEVTNRPKHALGASRLEMEAVGEENWRLRERPSENVTTSRESAANPENYGALDASSQQPEVGKGALERWVEIHRGNLQQGVEPPTLSNPARPGALSQPPAGEFTAARPDITESIQLQKLLRSTDNILTPRSILLLKILQHGINGQNLPDPNDSFNLDRPLTVGQAAAFAEALTFASEATNSLLSCLRTCAACSLPKYHALPLGTLLDASFRRTSSLFHDGLYDGRLSEFHLSPSGLTACCSQAICDNCYTAGVISSLNADYWHGLGSEYWVRCPVSHCDSVLPLRYNVELTSTLRELGDPRLLYHVMQFERANRLRAALGALDPLPTPEALRCAARLHIQLVKHGRMKDPLDPSLPPRPRLQIMTVDYPDGSESLQVPIFADLLIRPGSHGDGDNGRSPRSAESPGSLGRDCAVCAESLHDVTDGTQEDEARWMEAIDGFPGPWAWKVRPFPVPSLLPVCSATHSLDICRACLSRHLDALLESQGRAGSESLTCPSPGCGHAYSNEELRALASPETFARYDKLRLLSHLATLPDFRWCLRQGCNNGQVYDFVETHNAPDRHYRIFCDACGFSMCFRHQVPWHRGQTCPEYEEARGDPDFSATREWLRNNTKPCPGLCGASVEKNEGCFHMTCQVCRFEFCWECLADWSQISRVHPTTNVRRYYRGAHNPGCYFREPRAPQATMIGGNTVAEALGGAW